MIVRIVLSALLSAILVYALGERRRSPVVALSSMLAALAGLYFTWQPEHANNLAVLAGVGRGVDLVFYLWVCITLLVLLNLHLKLRTQTEQITALAREIAIAEAERDGGGRRLRGGYRRRLT